MTGDEAENTAPYPPVFGSEDEFASAVTELSRWRRLAEHVLSRHGLGPATSVRIGSTATFPVVTVNERWAVKFFPDWEFGRHAYESERDALLLLRNVPSFPAPELVAHGYAFGGSTEWRWLYLVTRFAHGTSLGSVREQVSTHDLETTARWLGERLRVLHDVDLSAGGSLKPEWEPFASQLSAEWKKLIAAPADSGVPSRLPGAGDGREIHAYLGDVDTLVDRARRPRLLHGDLHAWHIFGHFDAGHFVPTSVIDFGDALVGDILYEVVPLHLKTFRGDKRLLHAFAQAYGLALDDEFVYRAMCFTLLFDGGALHWIDRSGTKSLEDAAHRLWDVRRSEQAAVERLAVADSGARWTILL